MIIGADRVWNFERLGFLQEAGGSKGGVARGRNHQIWRLFPENVIY